MRSMFKTPACPVTCVGVMPQAWRQRPVAAVIAAVVAGLFTAQAHAFTFTFDDPDLSGDLNTRLSYSTAYRVRPADPGLQFNTTTPTTINLDDGNNAFQHRGLIQNRVDLFSEFDLKYKSYGVRFSGNAYYDAMYNRENANNSSHTTNNLSVPFNQFTAATRTIEGRQIQLLDAFVFGTEKVGSVPVTVRAGQLAQLWGETLFFGANGIAGGMSPIDVSKFLSDPSAEFKQIIMPTPQLTVSSQLPNNITLGAYYQFAWRSNRLPSAGSYFSSADIVGDGAESLHLPIPGLPPQLARAGDMDGKNSGQYGLQLRFSPAGWNTDFGLYAIRFNAKDPQLYATPLLGTYRMAYPNDVRSFGASFSTNLGDANVAGEVSVRRNMPLASDLVIDFSNAGNNTSNPLYAVGNTAHANLSVLYSVPRTPLWRDATLAAEFGWNRRLSITAHPEALTPLATRDAGGIQLVFAPNYYQVLPGLDISVPLSVGYNLFGRSSVVGFNGIGYHTGNLSIGVKGTYEQVWNIALKYTRFLGAAAPLLDAHGSMTFGQTLADRDYVSLSLSRSF